MYIACLNCITGFALDLLTGRLLDCYHFIYYPIKFNLHDLSKKINKNNYRCKDKNEFKHSKNFLLVWKNLQ